MVDPYAASAETLALAFGFQLVSWPVVASSAARLFLASGLTEPNVPPAPTAEPETASQYTGESALGLHEVAVPVVVSTAARYPRGVEPLIAVSSPPM